MRLIDADALKEYFKTIRKYHVGKYSEWYLADVLEQQPTVDAVPVVRCKDCKHWQCDDSESYCDELGIFGTDMNSYCSYAKGKAWK